MLACLKKVESQPDNQLRYLPTPAMASQSSLTLYSLVPALPQRKLPRCKPATRKMVQARVETKLGRPCPETRKQLTDSQSDSVLSISNPSASVRHRPRLFLVLCQPITLDIRHLVKSESISGAWKLRPSPNPQNSTCARGTRSSAVARLAQSRNSAVLAKIATGVAGLTQRTGDHCGIRSTLSIVYVFSCHIYFPNLPCTIMASRSLVSYDDITAPYVVPTKRRKRNKRSAPLQPAEEDEALDDTTQSRELTHEEIWDDSALVEAWNAATEEYEAYHGPDKGWKKEPLHKSPLSVSLPLFFHSPFQHSP